MKYLRNTWYMAAWSHEVSNSMLTRTILGERYVFYRKQDGVVVGLRDRCPHRFAPLSRGRLCGDEIQCGYHGLKFAADGTCVHSPFSSPPPRSAKVRNCVLEERHHIVWMWLGDLGRDDSTSIPDFSYITRADLKGTFGLSSMNAHYELVTDNLMDLSHVEFLHPAFGGALLKGGTHTVSQEGDTIWSNWWTQNVPNTPSLEMWWPTKGKPIDHSFDMRWNPPASIYLGVGATLTGAPRDEGFTLPSAHILTPETASTTLYFWHSALPVGHPQSMEELHKIIADAFDHEDAPMLEAVQHEMGGADFWDIATVMLRTDAGAVRVRKHLGKLIAAENNRQFTTSGGIAEAACMPQILAIGDT